MFDDNRPCHSIGNRPSHSLRHHLTLSLSLFIESISTDDAIIIIGTEKKIKRPHAFFLSFDDEDGGQFSKQSINIQYACDACVMKCENFCFLIFDTLVLSNPHVSSLSLSIITFSLLKFIWSNRHQNQEKKASISLTPDSILPHQTKVNHQPLLSA